MSPKEIQDRVMKITEETFKVVKKVYDSQKETNPQKRKSFLDVGSRIIFPSKRKTGESNKSGEQNKVIDRISEQELKFIFVERLNKYADKHKIDIHYSVETPTFRSYKFPEEKKRKKEEEEKEVKEVNFEVDPNEGGRSARTDLTIYDEKFNRICLIEFKGLTQNEHDYKKDFCKLIEETGRNTSPDTSLGPCLKFFIQIIESYDSGTLKSLKKNVYSYMEDVKNGKVVYKGEKVKKDLAKEYDKIHYICYYLKGPDEKHGYPDIITNVRPSEFKKYKVFEKEKIEYIGF